MLFEPIVKAQANLPSETGLVNSCEFTECGFEQLCSLANTVLSNIIYFGTLIAGFAVLYIGFNYITATFYGSSYAIGKSKSMITTLVLGFVIMLSAYLLVNFFFKVIGYKGDISICETSISIELENTPEYLPKNVQENIFNNKDDERENLNELPSIAYVDFDKLNQICSNNVSAYYSTATCKTFRNITNEENVIVEENVCRTIFEDGDCSQKTVGELLERCDGDSECIEKINQLNKNIDDLFCENAPDEFLICKQKNTINKCLIEAKNNDLNTEYRCLKEYIENGNHLGINAIKFEESLSSDLDKIYGIKPEIWEKLALLKNRLDIGTIEITSGHRSKEFNDEIGGAEDSRHLTGCAIDIRGKNYSGKQVQKIKKEAFAVGFDYVKVYETTKHIHIHSNTCHQKYSN